MPTVEQLCTLIIVLDLLRMRRKPIELVPGDGSDSTAGSVGSGEPFNELRTFLIDGNLGVPETVTQLSCLLFKYCSKNTEPDLLECRNGTRESNTPNSFKCAQASRGAIYIGRAEEVLSHSLLSGTVRSRFSCGGTAEGDLCRSTIQPQR
ncbi:hypothetical protein OBBRIDRAFT_261252 [Obba rivulosa]|uniref:Uncharacterized protein n=1 Tax=Obba rivulosa TaxID=1052685 RepID=A0A8E2DGL2_9APHY|nr:hypothetical protein OBBRIDRAFT_261252 [Obba rivulosa]